MSIVHDYDYVIVGAGSAGCVLANRLSVEENVSVLLLEAGGWDRDPWIHIPLGWGKILQGRLHDWGYFCEPEESVNGRRIECARGKVIGGSSSTNAMAYVRGNRADYDGWAELDLDGWSYADVLPYFQKQETWEGGGSNYRGDSGPLGTQFCRYQDPLVEAFAAAGKAAGYGWTEDYNGSQQEGFGRLQMTIRGGRRSSGATAYLRPVLPRQNLTIETEALTTRVNLESGVAVGVEYVKGGETRCVRAAREVILSGGVINTPQLLMLSGIGDTEELQSHGIPVQVALPGVGKNLRDHVSVILMYNRRKPGPFHHHMRADRIVRELIRAHLFGSGFASDVPGGITAFLKSDPDLALPNLQYLFTAAPLGAWPYFKPFKQPFADGFATRLVMLQPESRGTVNLASGDPHEHPLIRQNFMAHDADWRTLRAGMRIARDLAAQSPMEPFIAEEILPGSGKTSDNDLNETIRNTAITVHHPIGTCRMGAEKDEMAVVDDVLKVRGVSGLRVVDASVMPTLVRGNINAAVVMIAEKGADLIAGHQVLTPHIMSAAPQTKSA